MIIAEGNIQSFTSPGLLIDPVSSLCVENLLVLYEADRKVLLVNWEGEINSLNIRKGYDIVMQQVKLLRPRKILLDFHNRFSIRRRDQRWVFSTFFPEILRTVGDNVFVAIVLPVALYHGLVADMNGDELMHNNSFLIIHHCLYREEAFRWLETMEASEVRTKSSQL